MESPATEASPALTEVGGFERAAHAPRIDSGTEIESIQNDQYKFTAVPFRKCYKYLKKIHDSASRLASSR